jgi:integrase
MAKGSAIRTIERLVRERRRQEVPPMPDGWYPHQLGDPFYRLDYEFLHAHPPTLERHRAAVVDRPRLERSDEIRFLDQPELEALLRATPDLTDQALFLAAAMTGLRQGELLALPWMDIDWTAAKIRVRRNYVRGHWTTPSRAAPPARCRWQTGWPGSLSCTSSAPAYQHDEHLVFCHPAKGTVLDPSKLVRRFKAALKQAGVRAVRFHDLRHTFAHPDGRHRVTMRTQVARYCAYEAPGDDRHFLPGRLVRRRRRRARRPAPTRA